MSRRNKRQRQKARQRQQQQKKQSRPPSPLQPQEAAQIDQRTLWERFRDHPIWWWGSTFATVLVLSGAVWQAFRGPELSLADAYVTLPFAAPISVTNESWPFEMTNAAVDCGVEKIRWSGGSSISGIGFIFAQPSQNLEPSKPVIFQCRIINVPRQELIDADMYVSVKYSMFWGLWHRRSDEMEITWFAGATPPRWIVGHFPSPHM